MCVLADCLTPDQYCIIYMRTKNFKTEYICMYGEFLNNGHFGKVKYVCVCVCAQAHAEVIIRVSCWPFFQRWQAEKV